MFPPVNIYAVFMCCVKCKNTTVCKRISLVTGGKHFSKTFSIVLNSENIVFNPYFSIVTCPMRKGFLWIFQWLKLLSLT